LKRITVVSNTKKDPSLEYTKRTVEVLSRYAECITVDASACYDGAPACVEFKNTNEIFNDTDAVVTIGGDGTILKIAPEISKRGIPVLGINLGRVGFMAEIEPEETDLLYKLFKSEYIIDSRMMLDVEVFRNDEKLHSFSCLNDAVIMNGSISKMIELELFCNDSYVSTYDADGLILSTPTGSTAYSLSAGGTVIDPALECILVTPVCAHSFYNSRPMIFSASTVLSVKDVRVRDENTYLTLDGNTNVHLLCDDVVRIKRSQFTTDLIRIKSTRFYNTVYNKLSERR